MMLHVRYFYNSIWFDSCIILLVLHECLTRAMIILLLSYFLLCKNYVDLLTFSEQLVDYLNFHQVIFYKSFIQTILIIYTLVPN
jgi:hypothetical protein